MKEFQQNAAHCVTVRHQ